MQTQTLASLRVALLGAIGCATTPEPAFIAHTTAHVPQPPCANPIRKR